MLRPLASKTGPPAAAVVFSTLIAPPPSLGNFTLSQVCVSHCTRPSLPDEEFPLPPQADYCDPPHSRLLAQRALRSQHGTQPNWRTATVLLAGKARRPLKPLSPAQLICKGWLPSFIGQPVRSDGHLGSDFAHNGIDHGPNSGVRRAAAAMPPRWVVTMPAMASRVSSTSLRGIRARHFSAMRSWSISVLAVAKALSASARELMVRSRLRNLT